MRAPNRIFWGKAVRVLQRKAGALLGLGDEMDLAVDPAHGAFDLGMPGMTMIFHVKDAAMLDQVKEGDKIQFTAERANGALTVTKIEAAK